MTIYVAGITLIIAAMLFILPGYFLARLSVDIEIGERSMLRAWFFATVATTTAVLLFSQFVDNAANIFAVLLADQRNLTVRTPWSMPQTIAVVAISVWFAARVQRRYRNRLRNR